MLTAVWPSRDLTVCNEENRPRGPESTTTGDTAKMARKWCNGHNHDFNLAKARWHIVRQQLLWAKQTTAFSDENLNTVHIRHNLGLSH